MPLGRGVTVLAHDANGLAAFNKPAGVLSHPNAPGDERRSLLNARYALETESFEWTPPGADAPQRLWLLNRLDSATSGVILVAADGDLATEIRAHFKRKQVRKVYHALVFGAPRQPIELWRDLLSIEKRAGQIRTSVTLGHVPAECRMTVVRPGRKEPRLALVRLEPRTGRSHQLRVQCAKRGLAIVGDQTYGDFRANREFAKLAETKRMFLHSSETTFEYEWRGSKYTFSAKAPFPVEFDTFL
jgi:tRNA pseudouridine65 synthase